MKKRVSIGLTITLLASGTTSAFASEHHPHPKQIKNVEFQSMNAPTTIEDMIKTYTNASVKVTYKDGSVKETPLKYNQLFLSKDNRTNRPLTSQTHPIPIASSPSTGSLISSPIMNMSPLITQEKSLADSLHP